MEAKTNIIAEDGQQDLFILREFDLPVELLFKAYTDKNCIEQWMGTKVLKLDNRNHGGFEFETSHLGNVVFKAHGTIHSLANNTQIVRTFEMEDKPIGVQLEILTFVSIDKNRSKLTIHVIYQSEKHRAEQLKMPFAYGINMAHNQLEQIMTKA